MNKLSIIGAGKWGLALHGEDVGQGKGRPACGSGDGGADGVCGACRG